MSISEHIRMEKRFTALEDEIGKLRQEISHLKGRLTVLGKKEVPASIKDLYEASNA